MTPRPRSEVLAALRNVGDNIDIPLDCCDHCAETRELARYSVERWEKIKAAQKDVERRERELKGRAAALSIRETQVAKREFDLESRHRWWRRLLVAGVALLVLWGMVP